MKFLMRLPCSTIQGKRIINIVNGLCKILDIQADIYSITQSRRGHRERVFRLR